MGKDVFMYSITLDPERDSPNILAKYAKKIGAGDGWTYLTGRPEDIQRLRRTLGFYYPDDPELDQELASHLGFLLMGNEPYVWWGTVPSTASPKNIANLVNWLAPGSKGVLECRASNH